MTVQGTLSRVSVSLKAEPNIGMSGTERYFLFIRFWAIPDRLQGVLLILHSGIIPGGAQGPCAVPVIERGTAVWKACDLSTVLPTIHTSTVMKSEGGDHAV